MVGLQGLSHGADFRESKDFTCKILMKVKKVIELKVSSASRARNIAIISTLFGWAGSGFAQSDAGDRDASMYQVKYVPGPSVFITLLVLALLVWLISQNRSLRRRLAKLEAQTEEADDGNQG